MVCKHIERFEREGRIYCLDCGKEVIKIKGTEVTRHANENTPGIEIKSRGKKDNMWMQKG